MLRDWLTLSLLGLIASAPTATGGEATAKTTFTIKGMTCGGCAAGVRIQLEQTEGVTAYEVSFEKGDAEVSYDPAKTTPERIAASVSKTGFAASIKEPRAGQQMDTGITPPEGGACSRVACEGDCCKEARRAATAAQDAEAAGLVSLARGVSPLTSAFNAAKARPRFLAILSPTCSACIHGAEAVKAAVLPAGAAVDVFIVWAPMLGSDGATAATASSAILTAPNVRQYWDPARRVGAALRSDVFPDAVERMQRSLPKEHYFEQYLVDRDSDQPEWDIYLFFEPGKEWAERAPRPSRWVRQTALFPKGEGGKLVSLLWTNDYASAPIEGSLTEQLKRIAAQTAVRGEGR